MERSSIRTMGQFTKSRNGAFRLLCMIMIGAWSLPSAGQTVKRLDQVAPHLKTPMKTKTEPSATKSQSEVASNPWRVAPPPPTEYAVKTPPAKELEPGIGTDLNKKNGSRLCQIVSGDPHSLMSCLNEVNQMDDMNLQQIALRVCVRQVGLASVQPFDRRVPCFSFASQQVPDPFFQGQAAQCRMSAISGPQPFDCLRNLFARSLANGSGSNSASASNRQATTSRVPSSSSSTSGAYKFQRATR